MRSADRLVHFTSTTKRPRAIVVAILSAALVADTGCFSLWTTKGPPSPPPKPPQALTCTRSQTAPVVDAIVTSSAAGLAAFGFLLSDAFGVENGYRPVLYGTIAFGAVSLVSTMTGFERTNRCRALDREAP